MLDEIGNAKTSESKTGQVGLVLEIEVLVRFKKNSIIILHINNEAIGPMNKRACLLL